MAPVCDHFGDNHLPDRRLQQALRSDRRLHAVQTGKNRLHRRAGPGRLGRPAAWRRPALPQGRPDPPRSRMGRRRHRPAAVRGPRSEDVAREAGLEIARKMGLEDPQVINLMVLHPAEGCFVEVKGKVGFDIDKADPEDPAQGRAAARRGAARGGQAGRPEGRRRHGGRGRTQRRPARNPGYQARRHREIRRQVPLPGHLRAARQAGRRGHRDRRAGHPDLDHHQPQRYPPHADAQTGRSCARKRASATR